MVKFISAPFKPVGRYIVKSVKTGKTKRTLLGGTKEETRQEKVWEQTGYSDCEIDGHAFAEILNAEIAALEADGAHIVEFIPLQSGQYDYKADGIKSRRSYSLWDNQATEKVTGGASFGYGYSYTIGVLIVYEDPQ